MIKTGCSDCRELGIFRTQKQKQQYFPRCFAFQIKTMIDIEGPGKIKIIFHCKKNNKP